MASVEDDEFRFYPLEQPEVGRDESGRFASNDATIGQGLTAAAEAIDLISRTLPMTASLRAKLRGLAETVARSGDLANAGERPPNAPPAPDSDGQWT